MSLSLIITTFNSPKALELVLKSVERQNVMPDEVIIADDGSGSQTSKVIKEFQEESHIKIIHSLQEDKGFRVARSRNKAIIKATSEYILLVQLSSRGS